nr:glycosyltransferase family 4 protein [Paenarthrobacter aurescens]
MIVRALVLGPLPGSAGGIGVMMSHVQSSYSEVSQLRFIDTGASGKRRLQSFLACVAGLIKNPRCDVAHVNVASSGSSLRKILLTEIIKLRRVPYVIHLHGGGYQRFYAKLPRPLKWVVRRFFRGAAFVIVLGRVWEDFVVSDLGVKSSAVCVLPNAVPGPATLNPGERQNRVLFAGKLVSSKGIRELLRAAELVSEDISWSLDLAGDCPDSEIVAAIENSSAPVRWHGWVDQRRLGELMSEAAVFALPSHAEGLPLSLLDAMAHGAMPVVTPVGSIPEVITHKRNGIIVEVNNAELLAAAIEEAFREKSASDSIRFNARRSWETTYSIETYRRSLDKIYCSAIDRRYNNDQ